MKSLVFCLLLPLSIVMLLMAVLIGHVMFKALPAPQNIQQRLSGFPVKTLSIQNKASIMWNAHQVPYIEAKSDSDAAFLLGMVHAHLRLGQMELLKRVSQGRISEIVGPLTVEIDEAIRIFNFGQASSDVIASMKPATHRFLSAFVKGINHYIVHTPQLPHEFSLFSMEREPWTLDDLVILSRLYSADVNWIYWIPVLLRANPQERDIVWRLMTAMHSDISIGEDGASRVESLLRLLVSLSRSGSNSLVLAPKRTTTKNALIASDPHLGIFVPNLWLLVAVKSPSYNMVGLTLPGMPFIALGRNRNVAWGGTNMRALSTSFYDVSGLSGDDFKEEQSKFGVRFWFDKKIKRRVSQFGPVLSDAAIFNKSNSTFAVKWLGHYPSDEFSAFLAANRAEDVYQFNEAFKNYSVSAQNFVAADTLGNITHVFAVGQADYRSGSKPKLLLNPASAADVWRRIDTAAQIAPVINPRQGFIASANSRPLVDRKIKGYFYSPPDRKERMEDIVNSHKRLGVKELMGLQLDTLSVSSLKVLKAARDKIDSEEFSGLLTERTRKAWQALINWDGRYQAVLPEPALFELFFADFAKELLGSAQVNGCLRREVLRSSYLKAKIVELIKESSPEVIRSLVAKSLKKAVKSYPQVTWGELHTVVLAHPASRLPLIGRRYKFLEYPADGTLDSLFKTAHGLVDDNSDATTRYGSVARHISDLSDLNENYFVLLGGQDGYLNSNTSLDQVDLWLSGKYVRVPLEAEEFKKEAVVVMELAEM